ncbi:putative membrane protein [Duganella sp. SG902]|uniref:cytochrome c oxidase assembly protein n=1 Tax=Duganella sp. SG902 TaxID=2587016 RepID=UPI00159DB85A|nr:cytochrome c oxidase assembly protein [Duganella sp. SG902]NVM77198.1 putative membrane protein [Duganella sp. SG902]
MRRLLWRWALCACAALLPLAAASAHVTASGGELVAAWGADPWVLACLALSLTMYLVGVVRLYLRARNGRATLLRQGAWFGAGWLALVAALASPLDAAGSVSFAAHMVQHELLMIVAAPLLVLGRPLGVWLWAWPSAARRGGGALTRTRPLQAAWRALTRPLHAWLLHFAALWLWHAPYLFQAALASPALHALQHASFLFPALLFWWAVLDGVARGPAIAYLFTTMLHTGALGALFAVSGRIWYPAYGGGAAQFGLSALEDQQLGGLIMWVPGGLAYLIVALALCARWLAAEGRVA